MPSRPVRRFVLHYLEMLLAMGIGMMLLYPLWMLITSGADPAGVLRSTEIESLAMASTMVLPMAGWMRFRAHRWSPVLEMSAAMYAGFVVLFPALWIGVLDAADVMIYGHVLMFVLMLGAMLWRRE
ncbi:MAG: hypothetical protein ACRDOY_09915, partial [Nocardioidaceae bacterium]